MRPEDGDTWASWDDGKFEDTVAAVLIACFETKFKKNRGAAPGDRLTEERLAIFRNSGPYIPSPSRVVVAHNKEEETGYFDVHNDPLPEFGCVATPPWSGRKKSVYLSASYIRRTKTLGKYWVKRNPGILYEMFSMDATNHGIEGERRFFTVSKEGVVMACTQRIPNNHGYQAGGMPVEIVEPGGEWRAYVAAGASFVLQWLADRRFCWSITAQEKSAKAHLGCMKEEIKSLLYARSLPMTATGRKRPILHLVEAHKRRLQAGTDIDITAFLRGTQTVEISGTVFMVRPPDSLAPHVSQNSRDRYFPHIDKVPMLPIKEAAE